MLWLLRVGADFFCGGGDDIGLSDGSADDVTIDWGDSELFCEGDDDTGLSDGSADAVTVDWGDSEGGDDIGLSDGSAEAVTMASTTSIIPCIRVWTEQ